MFRDLSHAGRVFVLALVKWRFGFWHALWWARRSMIGPDDV